MLVRLKVTTVSLSVFMVAATLVGCLESDKVAAKSPPAWAKPLELELRAIDAETSGNIGVYVLRRGTGEELNYQTGDRKWYLASTVKVPIAIALLQKVEEGQLRLDQKLTLKASDPVDGSGEVQFKKPGSKLSLAYLLEKMLTQSDSTATDMLVRLIGEDELNSRIREKMGVEGFEPFTTILRVRQEAFSNLHPNAAKLTNRHFIDLKRHKKSSAKYRAIAKQMRVPVSSLQEKSIEDAFEKYYETGLNSGSLQAFGQLLENLAEGKLLSNAHTELILKHMVQMTTGENRLKAGSPKDIRFAQKTGTQVSRICNVGIAFAPVAESRGLIVAACVEKFSNFKEAEGALAKVGKALTPLLKPADSAKP